MRWAVPQPQGDAYYLTMNHPIGDYLACIVSLIVLAIVDWPDLISLGCDLDRMPSIEPFRATVGSVVVPILNSSTSNLPPGSYRGVKSGRPVGTKGDQITIVSFFSSITPGG